MKPKYAFLFALNLLISVVLAGLVVVLFSKEQEKERFIQTLQEQQQLERQKAVKARQEGEAQEQFEEQMKLKGQKALEVKNASLINNDLDKIDACLKRVLDEPSGYANETKTQRDTQEELLRQLAHCAKTEIGLLMVEMKSVGFSGGAAVQQNLDVFFSSYEDKIHDEHLSYDYLDLGMANNDHKKELDAESAKLLQAAYAAKRAIHNLQQNPK